jgi:hypothetical protein
MISEEIKANKAFIDLNRHRSKTHTPEVLLRETANEFRENDFRTVDGLYSYIRVSKMCCALQRQLQGQELHMLGSVPYYGFCSTYLSGKPERYRSMPSFDSSQALSHGLSLQDFTQHLIQCKSNARLAHIWRLRPGIDFHSPQSLGRRRFRSSSQENRLCIGCNDHRSLFVSFPLGPISQNQSSREAAYPSLLRSPRIRGTAYA